MRSCLGFLAIYAVIKLIVIGVGLGIGFLLRWLIPAIDLGIGTLIGVVATGIAMFIFVRILALPLLDDDADEIDIIDTPQVIISSIEALPSRSRRKRKSSGSRSPDRPPRE
jgi:hypothetical protein